MARSARGESERETRRTRIDPKLLEQGWEIVPFDPNRPLIAYTNHAVTEFPTADGPADYALFVAGRPLGIVEAKRVTLGPQNVLTQSERYSKGVQGSPFNFRGFRVPFLYSTNGEVLWFHDIRERLNRSRRVVTFHTPAALQELLARDIGTAFATLDAMPNNHQRLRPYQKEANAAIEETIRQQWHELLLAMATGTGKTFTMVNQTYRLMKSGVARRVLFLVDRRALAAQAVRAFKSFEPEPSKKFDQLYEMYSQRFRREDFEDDEPFDPTVLPTRYLLAPQAGDAFLYVCTIQRMAMYLFGHQAGTRFGEVEEGDEDADRLDIPIHAFDLIIADECHRGYTSQELSVWRDTLNYYDATRIGLTATPATHTLAYFRDIIYRYDYERAVREGYLVDYDVVKVKSNVRLKGVFLEAGETVGVIDRDTGEEQFDLMEDEREFDPGEIERAVTSPDSNAKIVAALKEHCDEHERKYGRFPKTLIFAAHDLPHVSHADQLVRICRDAFGRGDSFVQKITGRADRPLKLIRQFRNRPEPGIVVSVDLMSTGVDIPDLEIIVFLRPVQSRILFEQMIGRGTRKGEKYPDKSHFTVFDCFGGTLLERFKGSTGITAVEPVGPSRTIGEIIEAIWENRDRKYNVGCLVKRLQRIDKDMSGAAREAFKPYLANTDLAAFAKKLPQRLTTDFDATMTLLRDPQFQELLVNYERKQDSFVVAYGTQDTVTTEWAVRDLQGRYLKPEDYLASFSRFVRENPERIEAIRILLDRPRDWSVEALAELKAKLEQTRERFTPELLQRAHAIRYRRDLVDIISMVKHAAREQEPLLTAEERVTRAFQQITADREFTDAQRQWLDRIRSHLIENLSIDRQDFDDLPVFARCGGLAKANREFEGELTELLRQANEAIAA